jgi:hypothetical protein
MLGYAPKRSEEWRKKTIQRILDREEGKDG